MKNYFEALEAMHEGKVVQYVGTKNGNVYTNDGAKFCMHRGCIFEYRNGVAVPDTQGVMVYDPDFVYEITCETVDNTKWIYKARNVPSVEKFRDIVYNYAIQANLNDDAVPHNLDDYFSLGPYEAVEEFAALIITECARVVGEGSYDCEVLDHFGL